MPSTISHLIYPQRYSDISLLLIPVSFSRYISLGRGTRRGCECPKNRGSTPGRRAEETFLYFNASKPVRRPPSVLTLEGREVHHWSCLVLMMRMSGVIPPLPYTPSRRAQGQPHLYHCPSVNTIDVKRMWQINTHQLFFLQGYSLYVELMSLTLIVLMWRIGWAHNNARKQWIGRRDVFVTVHPWYNYINNQLDATITVY